MKTKVKRKMTRAEVLERAAQRLVAAYERGKDSGGSIEWEDLDEAWTLAREALKLPETPEGPFVVLVDIRGGNVQHTSVPVGVELVIRDWDNYPCCGGEKCRGRKARPCQVVAGKRGPRHESAIRLR